MNTIKETVEAYVRSQIPELMELSIGCYFRSGGDTWKVNCHKCDGLIYAFSCSGDKHDFGGFGDPADEWDYKYRRFSHDDNDIEIIGHPIQLQHWLRVLAQTKRGAMSTVGVLDGRVRDGMGMTPQSYYMTFNLTTGQPATEADYQALAEILNIEV